MRADSRCGGCLSSGWEPGPWGSEPLGVAVGELGWPSSSAGEFTLSSSQTPEICGRDHISRATVCYVPTITVCAASLSSSVSEGPERVPGE